MWKIIQEIVDYIPVYLMTFARCLTYPVAFSLGLQNVRNLTRKRGNKKRHSDTEKAIRDALVFLVVSLMIATIARVLSTDGGATWDHAIGSTIASFLSVFVIALVLRSAWFCVGGKFLFWDYFVLDCYYLGVISVVLSFFFLVTKSLINIDLVVSDEVAIVVMTVIAWLFMLYWSLAVWVVYASVNSLSTWRTYTAYAITHVFAIPALIIVHALEVRLQGIAYFGVFGS
jgi:hypothetical protein